MTEQTGSVMWTEWKHFNFVVDFSDKNLKAEEKEDHNEKWMINHENNSCNLNRLIKLIHEDNNMQGPCMGFPFYILSCFLKAKWSLKIKGKGVTVPEHHATEMYREIEGKTY
jgi:hypothetical protein